MGEGEDPWCYGEANGGGSGWKEGQGFCIRRVTQCGCGQRSEGTGEEF